MWLAAANGRQRRGVHLRIRRRCVDIGRARLLVGEDLSGRGIVFAVRAGAATERMSMAPGFHTGESHGFLTRLLSIYPGSQPGPVTLVHRRPPLKVGQRERSGS